MSTQSRVYGNVTPGGARGRTTAHDLTLETKIETEDGGVTTVRELVKREPVGKVSCRAPFRDAEGWPAYFGTDDEGMPFVHDSGTGITHRLNKERQDELRLMRASATIDAALPAVESDSAAALDDNVVEALAAIKHLKEPEYQRKRAALKNANGKVSLAAIDRAVKACQADKHTAQTHHGYAQALLDDLSEGDARPVGFRNQLFVVEPDTRLWVPLTDGELAK